MKRREFVRNASLSSLALGLTPFVKASEGMEQQLFTTEELTGKALLDLYGEGKSSIAKKRPMKPFLR